MGGRVSEDAKTHRYPNTRLGMTIPKVHVISRVVARAGTRKMGIVVGAYVLVARALNIFANVNGFRSFCKYADVVSHGHNQNETQQKHDSGFRLRGSPPTGEMALW